jgi:pSer/pThr/pTyr-binding forkhead associated (FHA) protein
LGANSNAIAVSFNSRGTVLMQSWLIGSGAECDVVVGSPLASRRHCQLTRGPGGLILEDLGSAHGTYVDGRRITVATHITPSQEITIGQTMPMPWPSELVKFVRIGRVEENDIVLDDLRVSSRHARLMIVAGSEALIEDLGSSNGTFLNSVDSRVTRLTPLSTSDTVYFGSLAVPASQLLAGLLVAPASSPSQPAAQPPPLPTSTRAREESQAPLPLSMGQKKGPPIAQVAAAPAVSFLEGNRWVLSALGLAPLLAFLIVLISGRHAGAVLTDSNGASIAQAVAATTFELAVAAACFGCSLAVAELAEGSWPRFHLHASLESFLVTLASRLGVLALACALGCALLLAVVYWASGLKGPWLPMWCVMAIASAVCLLLGLVLSTAIKSWQIVALVAAACFVLMTSLGGWLWPLPRSSPAVTWAMSAMPTRWAFEGLLLLEAPHHPSGESSADASAVENDCAEAYFPAEFQRMGPGADLTALVLMLVGMTVVLVVLAATRPS